MKMNYTRYLETTSGVIGNPKVLVRTISPMKAELIEPTLDILNGQNEDHQSELLIKLPEH